jgi:methylmalonyl-CoA epimerase
MTIEFGELPGVIGFDHVGILVEDFAAAGALLGATPGIHLAEPELEPVLGLEILWARVGATWLELMRPTDPGSRVARLLEAGEGGVHHVAFTVADIESSLAGLKEAGVRLRDETPRVGAHGSLIAFLDPDSLDGTLVEMVQRRDGDGSGPF